MSLFNFMRFVFILIGMMASVFVGAGAWKIWSTYNFAAAANEVQGTFVGYHEQMNDSRIKDSHGFKIKSQQTYPMFSYIDVKGKTHIVTSLDIVVFRWYKNGDRVTILVSPDEPGIARLASFYYLYGSGGYLFIGGVLAILVLVLGSKKTAVHIGPSAPPGKTAIMKSLQGFAQKKLPIGDFLIVAGGFVLVSGIMLGVGTYYIIKRQDPALIEAMQAGDFESARMLAIEGRGIDAKNSDGEPALIVALKENRPKVARAILRYWTSMNVVTSKGTSGITLAAANGDHQTLALMLKKGAETFGLNLHVLHQLIIKGDADTLDVIFSSSFNPDTKFNRFTFGDHAVMQGKADVIRIIQKNNGNFTAPSSFIALVLDDISILKSASKNPNVCKIKFNRLTLNRFAKKIDKMHILQKAGLCIDGL